MADKINGGIAVSYEDQHLTAADQERVKQEIQAIISNEMECRGHGGRRRIDNGIIRI